MTDAGVDTEGMAIERKYALPEAAAYRMVLKAEAEQRPVPSVQEALVMAKEELARFEESRQKYAEASKATSLGSHGSGAIQNADTWDDWGSDWSGAFEKVSIVGSVAKSAAAAAASKIGEGASTVSAGVQDGSLLASVSAAASSLKEKAKTKAGELQETAEQNETLASAWSGVSSWSSWGKAKVLEAAAHAKKMAADNEIINRDDWETRQPGNDTAKQGDGQSVAATPAAAAQWEASSENDGWDDDDDDWAPAVAAPVSKPTMKPGPTQTSVNKSAVSFPPSASGGISFPPTPTVVSPPATSPTAAKKKEQLTATEVKEEDWGDDEDGWNEDW